MEALRAMLVHTSAHNITVLSQLKNLGSASVCGNKRKEVGSIGVVGADTDLTSVK